MQEKEETPAGVPGAASALFHVCGICGWSPRQRSQDLAEEIICHANREVGDTLLQSLRLNACMSAVIVRATHLCTCGSCILTSKTCNRLPQWKEERQVSALSDNSAPLSPQCLLHSPLQRLAHDDAHRLGSDNPNHGSFCSGPLRSLCMMVLLTKSTPVFLGWG
jgi:hypothetical protein